MLQENKRVILKGKTTIPKNHEIESKQIIDFQFDKGFSLIYLKKDWSRSKRYFVPIGESMNNMKEAENKENKPWIISKLFKIIYNHIPISSIFLFYLTRSK